MYRKLFINFGDGKESICSVGPFTDRQLWSDWLDWLVALTAGTEVTVKWQADSVPTTPVYSAMTSPGTVLEAQQAFV